MRRIVIVAGCIQTITVRLRGMMQALRRKSMGGQQ